MTSRASQCTRLLATVALTLAATGCAAAATRVAAVTGRGVTANAVAVGQTTNGALENSDQTLQDGSKMDQYLFTGRRGEKVTITMRAGTFDAFLLLGTLDNNRFTEIRRDDDGAGGTDAMISLEIPANATYAIRTNSLAATGRGAYTLSITEGLTASAVTTRTATRIEQGTTVSGTLENTDITLSDNTKADDHTFTGKEGERITVTMRSSGYDTYMLFGRTTNGSFTSLARDDDGAGGTDSRITLTLPTDGDYTIRANAVAASARGAYTLQLESNMMPAAPVPNPAIMDIRREVGTTLRLDNVVFDVGRATLRPESSVELDRLAAWMRENPTAEIEISGHTDNTGVAETNRTLSEARAKAVVDYVTRAGISFTRMTGRGFGAERPLVPNDTEAGRQQNRRVEVRVTKI